MNQAYEEAAVRDAAKKKAQKDEARLLKAMQPRSVPGSKKKATA